MQPNSHVMNALSLKTIVANQMDANIPVHNNIAGIFEEIVARLVQADAMEKQLENMNKPDNVEPIKPDENS